MLSAGNAKTAAIASASPEHQRPTDNRPLGLYADAAGMHHYQRDQHHQAQPQSIISHPALFTDQTDDLRSTATPAAHCTNSTAETSTTTHNTVTSSLLSTVSDGGDVVNASSTSSSMSSATSQHPDDHRPTFPSATAAASRQRPTAADLTYCSEPQACVTLAKHIDSFRLSVSVDQAWALIYQTVLMYRTAWQQQNHHQQLDAQPCSFIVPNSTEALCLHRDGSVHIANDAAAYVSYAQTEQKILNHLGYVVYTALNGGAVIGGNNGGTELSGDLEMVLDLMTLEEEMAEHSSGQQVANRTLDSVLSLCTQRLEEEDGTADAYQRGHYKAVCRALATESLELRDFLHKVCKVTVNFQLFVFVLLNEGEMCVVAFDRIDFTEHKHRSIGDRARFGSMARRLDCAQYLTYIIRCSRALVV